MIYKNIFFCARIVNIWNSLLNSAVALLMHLKHS